MAFGFLKLAQVFQSENSKDIQSSIIGVDIGSSSIKLVQIHNKKNTPILDTYGELQLGPYVGSEIGQTKNLKSEEIVKALVDLVRESSVTGNTVALSISHQASFVTVLVLPESDIDKLPALVPVEARKHIPFSLEEVTLDWHQMSVDKKNNKSKILLAAIDNVSLEKYRTIVSGADLDLKLTELEVFSTIRSSLKKDSSVSAIIDFGASGMRVYTTKNGNLTKVHSTLVGGQHLTECIAKDLQIDFAEAEQIKRDVGLSTGQDISIKKVIEKELDRSFGEIRRVIEKQQMIEGATETQVVMVGGSALLPGLLPYVSGKLQKKVKLANSFTKVGYPAFLEDTLKEIGPQFAVAIGVALRGMSAE